jgi:hypothetical protein
MQTLPGDAAPVSTAIQTEGIGIENDSEVMTIAELQELAIEVEKYKSYSYRDTSIRSYAVYLPLMKDLKDFC